MENDTLMQRLENQGKLIEELTKENEQLFQQFNHLMVRNTKLLKRIDDLQELTGNMHLRMEELQLINDNLLKLNDTMRMRSEKSSDGSLTTTSDSMRSIVDQLNRRIDELHLRNDILQHRTGLMSRPGESPASHLIDESHTLKSNIDTEQLFQSWKNYPGQDARNAPNLRKQSQMLLHLYENKSLRATDLFYKTGVNGVTGARYVAVLKKFSLIEYKGARKKGQYVITPKGIELIEKSKAAAESGKENPVAEGMGKAMFGGIENADL